MLHDNFLKKILHTIVNYNFVSLLTSWNFNKWTFLWHDHVQNHTTVQTV